MKKLKKFFVLFLLIILVIETLGTKIANAVESQIYLGVPIQVVNYAKTVYKGLAMSMYNEQELYDVKIYDVEKLTLGKPFIILDVNNPESANIYYFPVIENNTVVSELMVYLINENYCASMTNNISNKLNQYNYLDNLDMVFYYGENELYCEVDSERKVISERVYQSKNLENGCMYNDFLNLSYKRKKEIIDEKKQKIVKIVDKVSSGVYDEGENGFSQNDIYGCLLNMNNCAVVQSADTCWAASVASTVRYITGNRTLTDLQVISDMGMCVGAANIEKKQEALMLYGIYYSHLELNSQLSFSGIRYNISNQKPILISTMATLSNKESWHALTVTGFTVYGGVNQVQVWNSATGRYETAVYNSSGTGFAMNGSSYKWKHTLRYK